MPRDLIVIENAEIIIRNFAGAEGPYNRAGDRNFCVLLPEPLATELDREGWNVRALRAREEGDPDRPYLSVAVGFQFKPPRIVLIGAISKKRTVLDEETCNLLDWVNISAADISIRPYKWDVAGKSGIKAYLNSAFVTIDEDPLELKYAEEEGSEE